MTDPNTPSDNTARRQSQLDASRARPRIRLCVMVTVDVTLLNLCRGRFEYLMARGFDVTVVCAPTPHAEAIRNRGVRLFTFPLTRRITPWTDLRALLGLYRFLRRERFDLVEVSTPKAALLGSIAARLAGVPRVVHLLRGLAYESSAGTAGSRRAGPAGTAGLRRAGPAGTAGLRRAGPAGFRCRLMQAAHRIPCRLAHRVISVSEQTRDQACGDGLCPPERITVLGAGSSNGVDLERFRPPDSPTRARVRNELGLPTDAVVAGICARLTRDKGIVELVAAVVAISQSRPALHLLLVGDYDLTDRPPDPTVQTIRDHPRIHHVGWQADTVGWMSAMDYFVLPTHREGLGTVLLEAAAVELPVITTDAAGWWNVVQPGADAVCVPAGDLPALRDAMQSLTDDASLRKRLGEAGRNKVAEHFDCRKVWALQEREFRRLVGR